MKTYSFKAHEIGTEVWFLHERRIRTGLITALSFVKGSVALIGIELILYDIGYTTQSVSSKVVFLTKEEAEKTLNDSINN